MLWPFPRRVSPIVAALLVFVGRAAADELAADVDQQIQAWRPTPEERRVDQIGWAADIRAALRLAQEHQRPVFLFTHDGRLETGRQ